MSTVSFSPYAVAPVTYPQSNTTIRSQPAHLVRFDEAFYRQAVLSTNQNQGAVKQNDVFRDTKLRYMGYANEFTAAGMASGISIAKRMNPAAWAIVFTYGVADALNRAFNRQHEVLKKTGNKKEAKIEGTSTFAENLIFHSITTWYGPVYTVIKPVAKLTEKLIKDKLRKDPKFWPSIAGLATIPFIPKIFDPLTEKLMEIIYQPISEKIARFCQLSGSQRA